eukprot:477-Alexandrium_andersonii.AAC.1
MCIRDSSVTELRTQGTVEPLSEAASDAGGGDAKAATAKAGTKVKAKPTAAAVSYTHLTLPTICSV